MPETIRLSLDTEFNEQNLPPVKKFGVDFISIGLTNIDREFEDYYAVSRHFNEKAAQSNSFVNEQVLPKLKGARRQNAARIGDGIREYLARQAEITPDADKIEFWSKNGTYDEFILCRLFGGMNKLYDFTNGLDIRRTKFRDLDELKYPPLPRNPKPQGEKAKLHHALYDAQIQADVIRWVESEARLFRKEQDDFWAKSQEMRRRLVSNPAARRDVPRRLRRR